MNLNDQNIINNYNTYYKENEFWFNFMNDGYCDLDENDFPIDINYKLSKQLLTWKYQTNLYKKTIDLGNVKDGNILDIACGRGGGLKFINDFYNFDKLVGVDINPNHIKLAKSINKNNVKFMCNSIIDTNFKAESFDVISCIEANTYFSPYDKFIEKIYNYLKQNGVYIQATAYTEKYIELFEKTGLHLIKSIDITKNVRMSCAISKMRFKNINKDISDVFKIDEKRYNDDTSNYMIYVFKK